MTIMLMLILMKMMMMMMMTTMVILDFINLLPKMEVTLIICESPCLSWVISLAIPTGLYPVLPVTLY